MSHAIAAPLATRETHPGYFLIRRLHSFTGVMFGLYLCVHLLVNATLIQGPHAYETLPNAALAPSVFQMQVDQIHRLPFLPVVEIAFIFGPLLVHTIYGIYIVVNGKPNVGSYSYIKNWFYVLQRVSAIALVLFIFFHVGAMFGWFEFLGGWWKQLTFEPHNGAFESTVRHVQASWFLSLVVYPLGVIAGTFHLANGFWTAGIAWGLTVSQKAQTRWGWVCLGLFLLTTALGLTAIVATFVYSKAGVPTQVPTQVPTIG